MGSWSPSAVTVVTLEILCVGRLTKSMFSVTSGYSFKSSATSFALSPPTLVGEDLKLLVFSNRNNLPNLDEPLIQV